MRLLFSLVVHLLFVLALPVLLTHRKLRDGIGARWGRYPSSWPNLPPSSQTGPRIWVHGASAGDLLALIPLVRELRARSSDAQIIATTITDSGLAIAERERELFSAFTFLPYDLPGPVNRAIKRIAPDVLVLEYTELWPQLIHSAHRQGVPIVLHNGRFSANNLNRYHLLFKLTGNLLSKLSALLMRDDNEAERARQLGASPSRVHVTGNTKFDGLQMTQPPDRVTDLQRAANFPEGAVIWVIGSTHEGEEPLLLNIFHSLRSDYPNLHAIIAPRYTDRADKVRTIAQKRGYSVRLRSEAPSLDASSAASQAPSPDILILDTIGELAACYSVADLVFVGGSFVARGGQNILEPAACGKPVLFGPHMENFADSVQVLLGRGGLQAATPEQLERVMRDLLGRAEHRRELGTMARSQVAQVRGAAGRNADVVLSLGARPS